jgi:predicted nucleic acid-binding protein
VKVYFDTSVLVAAVVEGHPHHDPAWLVWEHATDRGRQAFISAHGIAEVYAVLTRTPFVPRVHPGEAWRILEETVLPSVKVIALTAHEYRNTVRTCAQEGWTGGLVYDALHLRCARKAACGRIYTFNLRDFHLLAPDLKDKICAP